MQRIIFIIAFIIVILVITSIILGFSDSMSVNDRVSMFVERMALLYGGGALISGLCIGALVYIARKK